MDDLNECLSCLSSGCHTVDQKQREACHAALVRLRRSYESYSSIDETHAQSGDINGGRGRYRTAAEQKQDIFRLLMARKRPSAGVGGEAFHLVSWSWWQDWCRYVDFFDLAESQDEDSERTKHILKLLPPGASLPRIDNDGVSSDDDSSCDSIFHLQPRAIDNSVLFMSDSGFHRSWHRHDEQPYLKPNLVRGYHYEILPREVYFALRTWYGEITPSICRRTNEGGFVKLYPLSRDPPQLHVLPNCSGCRAPYASFKCKNCMLASYCDRECQQSHWPFHQNSCASGNVGGALQRERGLIGLNNLGNTCFMNSALQCMSHATPLTRHFLSNQFRKDINTSNPLGTGGKLALAYEVVMKELWMKEKTSSISPTALKRAISLFAPRFAGCLQHDAQEFLAYLLDGLHEDLNRIARPPYVEIPDASGGNMAVAGARAWDAHRKRNDSLVFDSFYGQFQSTCICPKCRKVSVSFDAFNHVSLEIPQVDIVKVTIPILFFRARGGASPLRYAVNVPRGGSVADVKSSLAELTGVPQRNMAFADIYNHNIYELLQDNKAVHTIGANDIIAAYEVEPFTSRSIHAVAINALADDKNQNTMMIGFPLMTSFHVDLSCQQIWELLWKSVRHCIQRRGGSDDSDFRPEDILSIHIIESKSKDQLEVFPLEDGKLTSLLPIQSSDSLLKYLGDKCTEDFLFLSLEWNGRVVQNGVAVVNPENFMAYTEHESIQAALRSQRSSSSKSAVSLDQCFQTFTKPERLDERNMWYCSDCKEHVKALKTMKLWRLPNILIVHLKRFAFKHTLRREKLDTFVDFPVDGLKMDPHCAERNSQCMTSSFIDDTVPAEYDLFGVINHFGRLGFGHYTAFARKWDENSMSDTFAAFDDSTVTKAGGRTQEIVSSAAYVLFYRRRTFN